MVEVLDRFNGIPTLYIVEDIGKEDRFKLVWHAYPLLNDNEKIWIVFPLGKLSRESFLTGTVQLEDLIQVQLNCEVIIVNRGMMISFDYQIPYSANILGLDDLYNDISIVVQSILKGEDTNRT